MMLKLLYSHLPRKKAYYHFYKNSPTIDHYDIIISNSATVCHCKCVTWYSKYFSKIWKVGVLSVGVTPSDSWYQPFSCFFGTFPKKCVLGSFSWMEQNKTVHRAKLQYWNGCVFVISTIKKKKKILYAWYIVASRTPSSSLFWLFACWDETSNGTVIYKQFSKWKIF